MSENGRSPSGLIQVRRDQLRAVVARAGVEWGALSRAVVGTDGADLAAERLADDVLRVVESEEEGERTRRLPPPMRVAELLQVEEPAEDWLAEGVLPAGGNVLLAAYPKSFKTMLLLELGVALASAGAFLGRFRVPIRRRVGIVLMEDQAHRVRRRLERLCAGRGIELAHLEGWLHIWFRPPLRLDDVTVHELAGYAEDLRLDFLAVDSWSYVAGGDHNDAAAVTPQLQALSGIRDRRAGITVQLTHHARKDRGETGDASRLTDVIRNSSAFGAWYDAGLVLSRKDETSPVSVRVELRDHATPDPFAFEVRDQEPAGPTNGQRSSGWLRLIVSDRRPEVVAVRAAAEKLIPAVREYLVAHPGASKRQLRDGIQAANPLIEAAFEILVEAGAAEFHPPAKRGGAGRCYLRTTTVPDRAPTVPEAQHGTTVPTVPAPPEGGALGHSPTPPGTRPGHRHTCAAGCGQPVGRDGIACASCQVEAEP